MPYLAQIFEQSSGMGQVCVSIFFFSDHRIKQIKNGVKTSVTHSPAARVLFLVFITC